MATQVKLNNSGIEEVLRSSDVGDALLEVAEAVASIARETAPLRTGEYRDSISAFTEQHADRVVAHVSSAAPHAMIVEAATGNLARALSGAGG